MSQSSTFATLLAARKEAALAAASGIAPIVWNQEQEQAISLGAAIPFKSFCLVGAAGTGKSTVTTDVIKSISKKYRLTEETKYLRKGSPAVAIITFTRRAANNARRLVHDDMKGNVLTSHKLLEYSRDFEDVYDPETGVFKTKVVFFPTRNARNPLPESLKVIVVDEASTLAYETLYKQVREAAPHCEFIFIGDLNQLPPVGGDGVLGYKLQELPTVELTHVYRQALESKPLALAHRVLSGEPIYTKELKSVWSGHPDLNIMTWDASLKNDWKLAVQVAASVLKMRFQSGDYDPDNDIVLCPFSQKKFCTDELNRWILDFAFPDRQVHQVIAGFNEHYLAVGDSVLYNKDDYVIEKINRNAGYRGKAPSDIPCDRWGRGKIGQKFTYEQEQKPVIDMTENGGKFTAQDIADAAAFFGGEEFEYNVEAIAEGEDDRVNQASHVIHLRSIDNPEQEVKISSSGDINAITFGHAVSVHKAQGSGWDRVFLFIHDSHATLLSRELLYTAITRTKKKLEIFCENDTFVKGIRTQRIPGKTAAEKAKYFREKAASKKARESEVKEFDSSTENTEEITS
jgi:hypothetical protein